MNTLFEKLKNQKSSRDNATGDLGINHQEQGHDPSSSSSSSAVKSSGSGSMESDAKRRSFHFKNRNKDEQDKRGKRYTVNMGRLLSRRKSVKNLQKSSGINDHRGEEDDDQEEGVKRTNQRIGILKLKNMSKVSARNNRAHVKYESVEMVEKSWKDLTAPWSTSDENERYIGEEQHGNDEEQMVHVDSCAETVDPLPIKFKTVIVVKRSSPRGALGEEEEEELEEGEEVEDETVDGFVDRSCVGSVPVNLDMGDRLSDLRSQDTMFKSPSMDALAAMNKVDRFDPRNIMDPMFLAIAQGDLEALNALIDKEGADAVLEREFELDRYKPLHFAAVRNQIDVMELLIDRGAIVDSMTSFRGTPLHLACSKGHREGVQLLVSRGADVKLRDMYGYSPFHVAMKNGHLNVAEDLLLFGVDIDFKKFDGKTALHIAAEAGRVDSVKWLIEKGARTTIRDEKGNTFLFGAVRTRRIALVQWLATQSKEVCNFCAVNNTSSNIIHLCVDNNLFDMITLIAHVRPADFSVLVNQQDKLMQRTPLHYAVHKNKTAVVELLLSFDIVNPNIRDERGFTPLHLLLEQPEDQISEDLLKKILMVPRVRLNIKGGSSRKTCKQLLSKMKRFRHYLNKIGQLRSVYRSMERSNDRTIVISMDDENSRRLSRESLMKQDTTTGRGSNASNGDDDDDDDGDEIKDRASVDCTQQ